MATKVATKRLAKEAQSMNKEPPAYCYARPREENILDWQFIIRGPPGTPYHGGEYWGQLLFPSDYPFKPPGIKVYTPSGRFKPDTKICTSMSDFHPGTWNTAWSVSTILVGLLSMWTSEELTTGGIAASEADRKLLAARSHDWNVSQPRFSKIFPEYAAAAKGQPPVDLPNMGEIRKPREVEEAEMAAAASKASSKVGCGDEVAGPSGGGAGSAVARQPIGTAAAEAQGVASPSAAGTARNTAVSLSPAGGSGGWFGSRRSSGAALAASSSSPPPPSSHSGLQQRRVDTLPPSSAGRTVTGASAGVASGSSSSSSGGSGATTTTTNTAPVGVVQAAAAAAAANNNGGATGTGAGAGGSILGSRSKLLFGFALFTYLFLARLFARSDGGGGGGGGGGAGGMGGT